VLGVDPGTVVAGWGVVEENGREVKHVAGGAVRLRGSRAERLAKIYAELIEVCRRFEPAVVVVEKTFVGENVQSAFRLGEARGAVMVAAEHAGVTVTEYSPAEIKVAVTGSGRADKSQMKAMVERLLGLTRSTSSDEADALAAAICHIHSDSFVKTTGAAADQIRKRGRPRNRSSRRAGVGR
jgi:crossover junction endodeoxyribonuclease RuvC